MKGTPIMSIYTHREKRRETNKERVAPKEWGSPFRNGVASSGMG